MRHVHRELINKNWCAVPGEREIELNYEKKNYHNSKQNEEASITRDTLRLKKRVEKKKR